MKKFTLREIHTSYGISRRAIQGYEKANLVSASGKNEYGHLLYDTAAVKRIQKIKLYQDMGFSIKEIQAIIDGPTEILKDALEKRAQILQGNILHNQSMILLIRDILSSL